MTDSNTEGHKKHHCMVVHAHYPLGETRVERQALALVKHGYRVDVIALRGRREPGVETIDGVEIHRLPVRRDKERGTLMQLVEYFTFFLLAMFKLAALHRRRRYGVVQVHNLPDFLVFAALVPKLMGARVVLDLHDLMPEFYAGRFETDLSHWAVRLLVWQERAACAFADHVITVTEPWRQTLIQRGVPADKVSVVMNVADQTLFQRPPEEEQHKPDGRFVLIYHGNITRRYGLDLAIHAVNRLRDRIPELQLIIHGPGAYRDRLMTLTRELGLDERVTFSTASLPTLELPGFLCQANLGIVPYRRDIFTDGILPTKLMEYAALGIPSIAARTLGIAAYFDENMVYFFEPDDAEGLAQGILTLYQDREKLAQLTDGIDKFNQRYNWSEIGDAYVTLIDRLAAR